MIKINFSQLRLYVFLIIFAIVNIIVSKPDTISPWNKFSLSLMGGINSWRTSFIGNIKYVFTHYIDLVDTVKKNKRLEQQINLLNESLRNYSAVYKENQRLQAILNMKTQNPHLKTVTARVIGWDKTRGYQVFQIDKGTLDKVKEGFPVISPKGLIGVVNGVTEKYAYVETILNHLVRVDAQLSRTREYGILSGSSELNIGSLGYLPIGSDVKVGDEIVTAGLSHKYPKNIYIGKIIKMERPQELRSTLTHKIIVQTGVDFSRLEEVDIVIGFNNESK